MVSAGAEIFRLLIKVLKGALKALALEQIDKIYASDLRRASCEISVVTTKIIITAFDK